MGLDHDVGRRSGHGLPVPRQRHHDRRLRARRRRRRRLGRHILAGFLTTLALAALVVGGVAITDARTAAEDLSEARAAVGQAAAALADGDVAAAETWFAVAEASGRQARAALGRPAVRAVGLLPVAERNLTAAQTIADGVADVASAARGVATATNALPGGAAALAPQDGALPLEPLAELAPALADAAGAIETSQNRLAALPRGLLLPPVAGARADLVRQLAQVARPARAGAALAETLPRFLGADGERRYVFGAQNPAELRGTGGLIGAWAELVVDDGRLEFGEFDTIGTLTMSNDERISLPAPTEDFEQRWSRFAATTHGSNINMSPDFPSVGAALLALHAHGGHPPADGVVLADPFLFAALLELTGPVPIADVGDLAADASLRFLAVEQYAAFPEESPRKPLLGEVAEQALAGFLAGGAGDDPVTAFGALAGPAGRGRLLLYSTRADEQAAFETAGVAGAFPTDAPLVGAVLNNAGANKLDYFLQQELDVDVWLEPDGSAWVTTGLQLTNSAPTSGYAKTVLGPNFDGIEAGEHRLHVSVYCGGCELHQALRDGVATGVDAETEFGHTVATTWENLPSGATRRLWLAWRVAGAWDPDDGLLRLTLPAQPAYHPVAVSVTVHAPEGRVVGLRGTPEVAGSVSWQGRLETSEQLAVHTRRDWAPASVAYRLWEYLKRPIF